MEKIGQFIFQAQCAMCRECKNPNLELRRTICEDFFSDTYSVFELSCTNADVCRYAYKFNRSKEEQNE